jgi:hypothetical protein
MSNKQGVLETIIRTIQKHDELHPDHGVGCACHDKNAGILRKVINDKMPTVPEKYKSRQNLRRVINYVLHDL